MYNRTILDNGVRIVSEHIEHLRSVSLGIWVNAGSRDEEEKENGISHLIEHMIFKGTNNRDGLQIAKEFDAIGGMSNAFTGKETTCFHAKVLGKHFTLLGEIITDIFLNSVFDPNDLAREIQVILQEINMVDDTPDDHIHVLFNRNFWQNHPIGMPILGTFDTVSTLDKTSIQKYIGDFYVPERILVVAAGSIDHDTIVSYFKPLFESLEGSKRDFNRKPPVSNSSHVCHYKDLEQVHICLGGEAVSLSNEKRYAYALFNTILGGSMSSRLFQEIRENKGLAYSVYSFLSSYMDIGLLGVYMATDPQNVTPALETIGGEIKKIIGGELSTADLDAAKEHVTGGIYLSSESADNRMMRLAKNEFVFERFISYEELVKDLEQVTVEQVIQAAAEVFQNGNVTLTTLGPFEDRDLDQSLLQFS